MRIACLKSLRIGSVQFASNSTHIKIASIAAAGASQSEDRNDKQKTGFFDSIDPVRTCAPWARQPLRLGFFRSLARELAVFVLIYRLYRINDLAVEVA